MNEPMTKKSLSSLAPLLLFAVFAVCIMMVLLSGADIYRKLSARDQNSIQNRTAAQYLTTRLHQSDTAGMVFVGNFEDSLSLDTGDTLYLRESLNGRTYYTRIYAHDGMLRELFAMEGLDFRLSDGRGILPIQNLHFTMQDQLLQIEITYEDGTAETLQLVLRSGKEDVL